MRASSPEQKQQRRLHILSSARQVLEARGMERFSIHAVAKQAQLAAGTLYLYFKKKEDLLAALVLESQQELLKRFQAQVLAEDDPVAQLRGILRANYQFYQSNLFDYQLASFYELTYQGERPPALTQATQQVTALVTTILARAQSLGLLRLDADPYLLTHIIWGTGTGMLHFIETKRSSLERDLGQPTEHLYFNYIEVLLAGITAKK